MGNKALIIIDVQYGQIEGQPRAGRADAVLANLNRAIALARRQHMPVIFIQHDSGPGSDLARDSEAWRLHPALARQDSDAVVHKRFSDSFQHTTLTELLRGDDIDELWLAGSATEFCVDSTLRSAMSQEYSVTLIADAHTCKPRPQLNAEQVIDHFNWVWSNLDETPKPLRVRGIAELESGAANENRRARPAVSLCCFLVTSTAMRPRPWPPPSSWPRRRPDALRWWSSTKCLGRRRRPGTS